MLPKSLMVPLMQARSLGLTLQYIGLDRLVSLIPGTQGVQRRRDWETQRRLLAEMKEIHERDLQHFQEGILPWSLLWTQSFLPNRHELKDALIDGWRIYRRRFSRDHQDLPPEAAEDVPDYYRRNFHFQTGGYFTRDSAERYDRQVDVLFSGTADAMRRSWILPLLENSTWRKKLLHQRGEGLRMMDLATGPGSAAQFLSALAPLSHLTLQDLSAPYLEKAQARLKEHRHLEVMHSNAESLPIKGSPFDLILSVYLFHELPRAARLNVLNEARRVLKRGGVFVVVDSIQKGDSEVFDPLLKDFPANYHEPFYMDYAKTPMRELGEEVGLEVIQEGTCFASKYIFFRRKR